MKTNLRILLWVIALGLLGGAGPASAGKTLYTCGMHPQIILDHPGDCPICGMKLVPVRKAENDTNAVISIDPVTIQNMGLRTALVRRGPLRRTIRSVANIDFDETSVSEVNTKFRGWIEKLFVDSTGRQVMRGDPLFSVYAPELFSAQTEYLLALEAAEPDALKTNALTKLQFYDVSPEQIQELEKTRTARKDLTVRAARDGVVIEKSVVEGQMVEPGMKLYRLADVSVVWVYAQIYEQDLPFVKVGQEAEVSLPYLPNQKFRGRVTYIYPTVEEKTRTARVRMEFHNPGYLLKPGMFATAEITAELAASALLVPDMAVLRSGEKNTVFVVRDGGKFEPRTVELGPRAQDNMYEVVSGLEDGDRVVTSGQFMLDSESQLREAAQKMTEPTPTEATAAEPMKAEASLADTNLVYICPMPEHVSIEYEHPGKCPLCGMALAPVSRAMLEKIQPGGRVVAYACPMPEDSDVRSDKPGKCPRCGMTLIPVMENAPLKP
ncbi:MAG TPA: efflux RND transporter periplasmic adaptor subunit [Verrucomicrobiae bacterium]|jgi:RND family efflux transporter MFP subunit|nr:efflux RND transporter periplasmic adaptor subunit [Verrucomicrobiae bacterium]